MQDQLDLISFTFSQKNINCSNCKWLTKVLENVNCSTQFIVQKMVYMYGSQVRGQVRLGVHVWQLGSVYMYGSQVRCWLGQVRLGQVRLGQVRLGQVRSQVRQGSLGHEQVRQIKLLTISLVKKLTFSVYMSHQKEVSTICHFLSLFCQLLKSG